MSEYLVPFEVNVLDSLSVDADTQGDAQEKVRSHLLSHKQEWGNFNYRFEIKEPAPVDPPQVTNFYRVTQFGWAIQGNEQFLIAQFDLGPLFDNCEFNHGLVVETALGSPVAIAWVDVQFEDGPTGDSVIGWINFRILPSYEGSAALIYSQTLAHWASSEPQLRLFAKYAPFHLGSRNSLMEAGFKYAGLKNRMAILCHRAGDQPLALAMARLRA